MAGMAITLMIGLMFQASSLVIVLLKIGGNSKFKIDTLVPKN